MLITLRIHIIYAFFLVFSLSSFAKEGFFADPNARPEVIKNTWGSVFFVLHNSPKNYGIGTAFLVRVENRGQETQLYFLTNNHVLKEQCPRLGVCRGLSLLANVEMLRLENGLRFQFGTTPRYNEVELVKRSVNPDILLLKVTTIKNYNVNQVLIPKKLSLSKSCNLSEGEKLYSIGFSDTSSRPMQNTPVENPNAIHKRWSEGIFTGYLRTDNLNNESTYYFAGTSVDVLFGGSGGPVFNRKGEVIGVMTRGNSTKQNNFSYAGSEAKGRFQWQSLAVPCRYLENFIFH